MTNENDGTVTLDNSGDPGTFGMNLQFATLPVEALGDGFNQYGVRENEDGSVDVRFGAMEPGERRGVDITSEFLQRVTSHDYNGNIPMQMDHSQSQLANVGYVDPSKTAFNDMLQIQAHVPNTGSSVRNDIIADFTHDPPQITDISVAFDPRTIEVEPPSKRGEAPEFVDARFREFSLTPFPGGYDDGGLTPEFSAAVEQAVIDPDDHTEPTSQLSSRPHTLITK